MAFNMWQSDVFHYLVTLKKHLCPSFVDFSLHFDPYHKFFFFFFRISTEDLKEVKKKLLCVNVLLQKKNTNFGELNPIANKLLIFIASVHLFLRCKWYINVNTVQEELRSIFSVWLSFAFQKASNHLYKHYE